MYHLNIYDNTGLPRLDIPEAVIAKLSAEQKAAFFGVISSYSDTTEADAALVIAEKTKRRVVSDLKRKMDAHEDFAPKRSFYHEWRRTVAKMPEPEPDPAVVKRVAASLKAIDKAHEYLAQCEAAEIAARQTRTEKRRAFATAVMAWSRLDGSPTCPADLVKARVKTETEQRLANIAAGMPADYAEHQQSTAGPSHLDRFKAGQGKGGSANYGYNRNAMRGAQLQKAPSES